MDSLQHLSGHRAEVDGARVRLRILVPNDASEEYASWLNDPETNTYLETRAVTVEELRRYIREKDESDTAIFFGIFWKENEKHIGNVKLEPIDHVNRTAMIGLLIGAKDYWGRGIGTEVTNLVTEYAFRELGIREMRLGVIAENTAAIRVYEKCGYEIDPTQMKTKQHGDVLYDCLTMVRRRAPCSADA